MAASMRTSETERTPSMGRHAYLSCGNASARATNLVRSVSRSARNGAFYAAADSFDIDSWARAGEGTDTSASDASARVANARRPMKSDRLDETNDLGQLLVEGVDGCSRVESELNSVTKLLDSPKLRL